MGITEFQLEEFVKGIERDLEERKKELEEILKKWNNIHNFKIEQRGQLLIIDLRKPENKEIKEVFHYGKETLRWELKGNAPIRLEQIAVYPMGEQPHWIKVACLVRGCILLTDDPLQAEAWGFPLIYISQ